MRGWELGDEGWETRRWELGYEVVGAERRGFGEKNLWWENRGRETRDGRRYPPVNPPVIVSDHLERYNLYTHIFQLKRQMQWML